MLVNKKFVKTMCEYSENNSRDKTHFGIYDQDHNANYACQEMFGNQNTISIEGFMNGLDNYIPTSQFNLIIDRKKKEIIKNFFNIKQDGTISKFVWKWLITTFGPFEKLIDNMIKLPEIINFSIDSEEATSKISNSENGTYLLRVSFSEIGKFAITVKWHDKVRNFLIHSELCNGAIVYSLDTNKYDSVASLIWENRNIFRRNFYDEDSLTKVDSNEKNENYEKQEIDLILMKI